MNRREFLKAGASAAFLSTLPARAWGDPPGPAAARPNIVLCLTDDQGWGDVSYNGLKAVTTAQLDAMARNSLRCDRFYAAAPVCSPTRGSLLTGRHPLRYGIFKFGDPLRLEEQTIAQALRRAGYATGHFGKWHLNGVDGPGKPVAGNDPLSPGAFGFDEWLSVTNFFEADTTFGRHDGRQETIAGDGSDAIVGEALKFIDGAVRKNRPFLALLWFGNPHTPLAPTEEYRKAAGGDPYYGEILGIDHAMGVLRDGLRQRQVADNTIVVFCSDNGATGKGSNGPFRAGKSSLYEGGVRVPGLIEWPARIRPAVTDVPVSTCDLYPTILDALGLDIPGQNLPLDGVSLVPLLDGKMTERPAPIGSWYDQKGKAGKQRREGAGYRFVRADGHAAWNDNRFKLHRLPDGTYELYDLVEDRSERRNLAAQQPDLVKRMAAELETWQDSVLRSQAGGDYRRGRDT